MAHYAKLEKPTDSNTPSCCMRCCEYSEPPTHRDAFFDNFKGMSSFCIVWMHVGGAVSMFLCGLDKFDESIPGNLVEGFNILTTIFTMPSFCFISGYLSSPDLSKARRTQLVRYAVTWAIQHAFAFFLLGGMLQETQYLNAWEDQHPNLNATNAMLKAREEPTLSPPGPLPIHIFRQCGLDWYLWCVVIWRVFLPLLDRLRFPLLLSVAMSLVMMFTDSSYSEYSNTPFGFLPFFILGYHMKAKSETMIQIRENKSYKILFLLFAFAVMLLQFVAQETQYKYLYQYVGIACMYGGATADTLTGYVQIMKSMNFTHPTPPDHTYFCQSSDGVVATLLFYPIAMLAVFGFMTLVPKEPKPLLTRAGCNAIYIYFGQVWCSHQWSALFMPQSLLRWFGQSWLSHASGVSARHALNLGSKLVVAPL